MQDVKSHRVAAVLGAEWSTECGQIWCLSPCEQPNTKQSPRKWDSAVARDGGVVSHSADVCVTRRELMHAALGWRLHLRRRSRKLTQLTSRLVREFWLCVLRDGPVVKGHDAPELPGFEYSPSFLNVKLIRIKTSYFHCADRWDQALLSLSVFAHNMIILIAVKWSFFYFP